MFFLYKNEHLFSEAYIKRFSYYSKSHVNAHLSLIKASQYPWTDFSALISNYGKGIFSTQLIEKLERMGASVLVKSVM